jgi:uncharacterized protein (DUF2267 family)
MRYDEFLASVRARGDYASRTDAERITCAVIGILGRQLPGDEARELAQHLPNELWDLLVSPRGADAFGVRRFLGLIAEQVVATEQNARRDASAVLTTVAEAVNTGRLRRVLEALPSGYAELFGRPDDALRSAAGYEN